MKKLSFLLAAIIIAFTSASAEIKYVFLMIGDGMGVNQVFATERYLGSLNGGHGRQALTMTSFPNLGLSHTYSLSNGITDSAAGGTALSSLSKTSNGVIAMDSAGIKPLETLAEMAHKQGKPVGVVTSVSIDHATPAVFYAHVPSRKMYYEIGQQLATSGFDFFAGAWFLSPKGKKGDQRDLMEIVKENGYTVYKGLDEYKKGGINRDKVILTQTDEREAATSGSLPYAIDRTSADLTLPQITESAVDYLYKRGKEKGFFLMVEGGQIDWACHGNDGGTAVNEVKDFDNAIKVVYNFYQKHPEETIIVISADHETGGLALGNSNYHLYLNRLMTQRCSQSQLSSLLLELLNEKKGTTTFEDIKTLLKENLGFYDTIKISKKEDLALRTAFEKTMSGQSKKVNNEYFKDEIIATTAIKILNKNSKLGWTTGGHSSAAVPIFSIGPGTEILRGVMENCEISRRIAKIAKYKECTNCAKQKK